MFKMKSGLEAIVQSAKRLSAGLIGATALALALYACGGDSGGGKKPVKEKGRIVFSSTSRGLWGLYILNADGSRNSERFVVGGGYEPVFSPDGNEIAFTKWVGTDNIHVINTDGTNLRNISNSPNWDSHPTWSPDGSRIAFARAVPFGTYGQIYVMTKDGFNQQDISNDTNYVDEEPDWSPDESKIAFTRINPNPPSYKDIWVMNTSGSSKQNLTNYPLDDDYEPAWSPDGTKIAFTRGWATSDMEIYVMNSNGSAQTRLTYNSGEADWWPAWSPDGTKIAFSRGWSSSLDVYIMDDDGANVKGLEKEPYISWYDSTTPDWGP